MSWFVYIILCSDDTLYTGVAKNIEKRFSQHASNNGAKYFRGRKPIRFVYQESGHDRSSATRREMAIKKLTKKQKNTLILSTENEIKTSQ